MMCEWCQQSYLPEQVTSYSVEGVEYFAHLCSGCAFCIKHGAPRIDEPFTDAHHKAVAFTKQVFRDWGIA